MTANPDVHPDPGRRWVAAHAAGWTYLVLGLLSAPLTAYVSLAPPDVIGTVAGLALLGTLAAALRQHCWAAGRSRGGHHHLRGGGVRHRDRRRRRRVLGPAGRPPGAGRAVSVMRTTGRKSPSRA